MNLLQEEEEEEKEKRIGKMKADSSYSYSHSLFFSSIFFEKWWRVTKNISERTHIIRAHL